jgi:hypothetical protein
MSAAPLSNELTRESGKRTMSSASGCRRRMQPPVRDDIGSMSTR